MRRPGKLRRIATLFGFWLALSFVITAVALNITEKSDTSFASQTTESAPTAVSSSTVVTPNISLAAVAGGFSQPTDIAHASDERLFVVERVGVIHVITEDGSVLSTPYLDISDRVNSSGNDRGLLGLAFHPDYETNGYFYVHYIIDNESQTSISRFTVSDTDPNVADPDSEEVLLTLGASTDRHFGGDLNFGFDGYLYISLGDRNSSSNGQDTETLSAKMLRIDVDSGLPYTVPPDNPFVGDPQTLDEIWALGLRNPWRFSFDRSTGDMFIGDVGATMREEIDYQAVTGTGGENYGWNIMEGSLCLNPSTNCNPDGLLTLPIAEYDISSSSDCAVTGGYVYRGDGYPVMVGHYLFADFCSGRFRSLYPDGAGGWQMTLLADFDGTYSTFGEGADGELYVARYDNGTIYHIQDTNPYLEIGKTGPLTATFSAPITYTLTITNSGNAEASNLVITDTIPTGASYVSGGTRVGNVISWTVPSLAANGGITQTTFVVTALDSISNDDYGVRANGGHIALGEVPVVTTVVGDTFTAFFPIIFK